MNSPLFLLDQQEQFNSISHHLGLFIHLKLPPTTQGILQPHQVSTIFFFFFVKLISRRKKLHYVYNLWIYFTQSGPGYPPTAAGPVYPQSTGPGYPPAGPVYPPNSGPAYPPVSSNNSGNYIHFSCNFYNQLNNLKMTRSLIHSIKAQNEYDKTFERFF